jgi:hypothetical protein
MIRIDQPTSYANQLSNPIPRAKWSHLWPDRGDADGLKELHRLAALIGLKRAWFQDKPDFPHYDLVKVKWRAAVKAGAVPTSLMEWWRDRARLRARARVARRVAVIP